MLNVLLDFVACGGVVCGDGSPWMHTCQDDDADLWKDLTFLNFVPPPKAPPVPSTVEFPSRYSTNGDEGDDISTLYDPYPFKNESNVSEDRTARLKRKTEPLETNKFIDASTILRNFSRSFSREDVDCDGSSYSSHRKLVKMQGRHRRYPWERMINSPDEQNNQMKNNHQVRLFPRVH